MQCAMLNIFLLVILYYVLMKANYHTTNFKCREEGGGIKLQNAQCLHI